jgi:phosphoserine phosphatase RsbU/P
MNISRKIILVCAMAAYASLLALPAGFAAQSAHAAIVAASPATFSIDRNHPQVASLNGLWRFHPGDDPRWADPDFDDSQWPLLRSDTPWGKQGYAGYSGYAWYRFKFLVADGTKPFSVLLPDFVSGYQLYANGGLIGSNAAFSPTRDPRADAHPAIFKLPVSGPGPQTIQFAIRAWAYKPIADWVGGGPREDLSAAGVEGVLAESLAGDEDSASLTYASEYVFANLVLVAGLTVLALFLFHPADREYLWFSVLLLANAAFSAFHIWMNLGSFPFPLWRLLDTVFYSTSIVAALNFFVIVLRVRRSPLWLIVCCFAAAAPVSSALLYFQWTGIGQSYVVGFMCDLPALIWIVATLILCALKKDASARLLVLPAGLNYGINLLSYASRISWQITGNRNLYFDGIVLAVHPFPFRLEDLINLIFVLALLIFLVRRFSLARQKETRLSNEMEAARSIQSLLVPVAVPSTPRFAVESVYLPANEVGGDFFQILPNSSDGSLLIVTGDVTGKGLQAGMLVALLVGAIRCTADKTRDPREMLQALNRLLLGRGDQKATCLALNLEADGVITLENAGHLPPHLNGTPLEMPGALPLGMIADAEFSEMRFSLSLGDRLVFMSDGIVEATSAKGELFGFERVNELLHSAKSAAEVAAAAQAFGQEDDISVISVTHTR